MKKKNCFLIIYKSNITGVYSKSASINYTVYSTIWQQINKNNKATNKYNKSSDLRFTYIRTWIKSLNVY